MRKWIGGGLVAAVVVAGAACGSVSSSDGTQLEQGEPTPAMRAAASRQTQEAATGRYELVVEMGGDDGAGLLSFELTGEGAFDLPAERTRMSMSMDSMLGELLESAPADADASFAEGGLGMDVVTDGDVTYLRYPMLSWMTGVDAEQWIRIDPEEVAAYAAEQGLDPDLLGDPTSMAGGQSTPLVDPGEILDWLEQAGAEVTEVGRDTVGGVDTTHYRAVVDTQLLLDEAIDEAERADLEASFGELGATPDDLPDLEIPIDVYVDDEGFVRRIVMELATPEDSDDLLGSMTDLSMSVTVDFVDLGEPVDIVVPDPSETVGVAELADGMMAQLGG